MNINPIGSITEQQKVSLPSSQVSAGAPDFTKVVGNLIAQVDSSQLQAENAANGFALGQTDLPQMVMALNQADLSLKLAVEVRNKAIDAYQEIMRMSI